MESLRELALFAGAGGGILGGILCGFRCVCAVETEPHARAVLAARQNDGTLPPFPIWDDVCTFDGYAWRGIVDVVSGGFPCQDISAAGKGAGIGGAKSGLWREMARIIGEVQPRYVIVENSPMLVIRGLGAVLGDLAAMGFDARWGVLGADDVGAPHVRKRLWIVAHANGLRKLQPQRGKQDERRRAGNGSQDVANANAGRHVWASETQERQPNADAAAGREIASWWESEPDVGRVANGVASRLDRLKALGNGQVPAVVKLAWDTLKP